MTIRPSRRTLLTGAAAVAVAPAMAVRPILAQPETAPLGALDLVVGGFSASTPWTSKAAVTVSYVTVTDADGKPEGHVMLTPMGENAFLVELERFLLAQDVEAP